MPVIKRIGPCFSKDGSHYSLDKLLSSGEVGKSIAVSTFWTIGAWSLSRLLESFRFDDANDYEYEIWFKVVFEK